MTQNPIAVIRSGPARDWQAFCTWYSLQKAMPDIQSHIVIEQNPRKSLFGNYLWAKKLHIPQTIDPLEKNSPKLFLTMLSILFQKKVIHDQQPFFIVKDNVVCLKETNASNLKISQDLCFACGTSSLEEIEQITNDYFIDSNTFDFGNIKEYGPVKDRRVFNFVNIDDGCGSWINTIKGCPFSAADRFASEDMTNNEKKVIDEWKKMTALYQAIR